MQRSEVLLATALLLGGLACAGGGGDVVAPDAEAAEEIEAVGADAGTGDEVELGGPDAEATAEGEPAPPAFVEFPWAATPSDPATERLCVEAADPDAAPDTIYIDCVIEGESFAPADVLPRDDLVILAYNLERGFGLAGMITALTSSPELPQPDVLLVSEADRGCARTDRRHVLRELAQALEMNYVYAVEFVELNREPDGTPHPCEHGNGVLSRYPLGNVRQIRHATNKSWYRPPEEGPGGEPRLGGRIAVFADVKVGDRLVHVYSIHFESNIGQEYRSAQAAELAEDGLGLAGPVVIGGDANSGLYYVDLSAGTDSCETVRQFLDRGYADTHASLTLAERITAPDSGFILDLIFVRNATWRDPGVGAEETCGRLSDHLPVWATLEF